MFGVLWASAGLSGFWDMFSPGKHLCCFWIAFAGLAHISRLLRFGTLEDIPPRPLRSSGGGRYM